MSDAGTCPRCGEHSMMTPIEINALSRTTREASDTPRWVCSPCGTDEGFEDAFLTGATEQTSWPLVQRTFHYMIQDMQVRTARLMNEVENEA
jgi:ribosomal protein S27AE